MNRILMSRYILIEKAKQSKIFGILVGTLVLPKYLEIMAYCQTILSAARKRFYTFVVGKINVSKLANFAEVDMFVLIAGPESSLLVLYPNRDYIKPMITPFELEIALVSGKEWTGDYTTHFETVLQNQHVVADTTQEEDLVDIDQQDSSLGVLVVPSSVSSAVVLRADQNWQIEEYSASKFFLQRTFKGLEQHLGETPASKAVEGLSGIPFIGYQHEGIAEGTGGEQPATTTTARTTSTITTTSASVRAMGSGST